MQGTLDTGIAKSGNRNTQYLGYSLYFIVIIFKCSPSFSRHQSEGLFENPV